MGDVEPDHRHVEPGVEDALRGLGIGPDVELGRRRHVALGDRAAHQHDPLPARMPRSSAQRDVRQRAGRDERTVSGVDVLGEEVDGVLARPAREARGGSSGPSSPLSPWTCAATCELAHERPVGAGGDRHVRPARRARARGARCRSSSRASGCRATVVTPTSSTSGLASASSSAIASSWPGSQSRMIGVAHRGEYRVDLGRGRQRGLRAEARRGERAGGAGAAERLVARRGPRAARRAGRR